ncbi:MAG: hypothetical protein HON55_04110 [Legionellales bacterium]|nr:hypothetical protein [Legionellales bacterium]
MDCDGAALLAMTGMGGRLRRCCTPAMTEGGGGLGAITRFTTIIIAISMYKI